MRALELDVFRRPAHRLVDDQIRDQRTNPGNGDVGIQPQHLLDGIEHAELHQHQRDGHVEDQPDHAPRMAVGNADKKVRPGQRACVGVGHVDLDLGNDHEQGHGRQRPLRGTEHVPEGDQVHLRRLGGALNGHFMLQGEKGQERSGHDFQRAGDDPSRPGHEQCGPPAFAVVPGLFREKAQVIDLLADLRHQRQRDAERCTEKQQVKGAAFTFAARETQPVAEGFGVFPDHEHIGHQQQRQPQWLGPHL